MPSDMRNGSSAEEEAGKARYTDFTAAHREVAAEVHRRIADQCSPPRRSAGYRPRRWVAAAVLVVALLGSWWVTRPPAYQQLAEAVAKPLSVAEFSTARALNAAPGPVAVTEAARRYGAGEYGPAQVAFRFLADSPEFADSLRQRFLLFAGSAAQQAGDNAAALRLWQPLRTDQSVPDTTRYAATYLSGLALVRLNRLPEATPLLQRTARTKGPYQDDANKVLQALPAGPRRR